MNKLIISINMQLYAIRKGGDFSDGRSLAVKNEVVTERGGEEEFRQTVA